MTYPFERPVEFAELPLSAVTILRSLGDRAHVDVSLPGFSLAHSLNQIGVWNALKRSGATVVVATPRMRDGASVDSLIAHLRARARTIGIVIIIPTGENVHDVTPFLRHAVGVSAMDSATSRAELRQAVVNAQPRMRLRQLAERVAGLFEDEFAETVRGVIEFGDCPRTIAQAAAELGISEDTLERRVLECTGLEAHTLRTWGRLLAAGVLLDGTVWTVNRIGEELKFGGGSGLCSRMKEYVGLTPSVVRQRGASECVLERLIEIVGSRDARS